MPAVDVDDGYTEDQVIPRTTRHPKTWIKFRPMLRAERMRLINRGAAAGQQATAARDENERKVADEAVEAATREVAKSLDRHLIEWDVKHRKTGAPIAITAEAIERLPTPLFEKIYNAVALFGEKPDQSGLPAEDESAKNSGAASS